MLEKNHDLDLRTSQPNTLAWMKSSKSDQNQLLPVDQLQIGEQQ